MTVKEIAAELGVSPMTVSNAYNRPDQLSADLRARVLSTAERMGYAGPSRVARDLRLGAPGTIGVVYDTPLAYAVRDAAAVGFLGGVAAAAGEADMHLLLLAGAQPSAVARGADGLIVYSVAEDDPVLAAALERRGPVVVVDQPQVPGVPFVGADDRGGARQAALHVLALGHRQITVLAFGLGIDGRWRLADTERRRRSAYPVTRERLGGYRDALQQHGVDPATVPVYESPGWDPVAARAAAGELLAQSPRPTAVLAMSDDLALSVLDAARDAGVDVPAELSVVGFDDISAAGRARPALTTLHQDHEAKGRLAAAALLARLRGEDAEQLQRLPARLVVRESTAAIS